MLTPVIVYTIVSTRRYIIIVEIVIINQVIIAGSVRKLNGIDNVKHEIELVLTEAEIIDKVIKEMQDKYEKSCQKRRQS